MRFRVLALVPPLALSLAACAQGTTADEPAPTTTTTSATTTTRSVPPTTTTAVATTSTPTTTTLTLVTAPPSLSADGMVLITEDVTFTSQLSLDVFSPVAPGSFPVVVVFHGGGWVGGHPDDIAPLATAIAAGGAVVFNAPYRLALRGGGYPMTFEDASCAVRFARRHAPEFGGDPGLVIVVGYSAGAHIGAITALAGDSFSGDCTVQSGSALPNAFVGVAGLYDTDLLDPLMSAFFGTERAEDPAPWEDGNPYTHIGANPGLIVRLVQGELDRLVPVGFAIAFEDALDAAGYDVELTIIEGGEHGTVVDPQTRGDEVVATVLALSG